VWKEYTSYLLRRNKEWLNGNMFSVRALTKKGISVKFDGEKCAIMKGDDVVAAADAKQQLYEINCAYKAMLTGFAKNDNCLHTWHRHSGHRNPNSVKLLVKKSHVTGMHTDKCNERILCDTCIKGKMERLPFPKVSTTKTKSMLDLVHSDLCGPMETQTPSGKRYVLTLIDDFSRYCTMYLLAKKSEVSENVQDFVQNCMNKFGCKPKIIRSDKEGEYLSNELLSFFKKNGIKHQMTAPYSPQQNGVAERKNRSLIEMARCMLIDAGIPSQFWGEAVVTTNYLQNCLPTRAIEKTPFEKCHGEKPDVKHLQIFGFRVFMHIPNERRRKLDHKALEITFIGYSDGSKAYRLLDTATNRV
jgi:transposase InsO family protein